jgi:tricorn protease
MPLRPLAAAAITAVLASPAATLAATDVTLPRHPAVSPDGSEVVFSWRGDLWKVGTDGGQAIRLTSHPADETRSIWSPDGQSIAFMSNRDGYTNIWRMRADGSDIARVTDLDRTCTLTDWTTVDGEERILFHAVLEADVYREFRPYHVSPEGGPVARVHDAFGSQPAVSPDGSHVLFARGGYYDGWERRHYRGAENQDVWLQNRGDGSFTQLTEWAGNDGKAAWLDDETILYLSDRDDRSVNLFRRSIDQPERRATRLTNFDGRDIHDWSLSRDGSTAVLMSWDSLYVMDLGQRRPTPRPIAITANQDTRDTETFISIGTNITDAALSPDGKVMAVIAYGEVWVRPTDDDGIARRVTRSHARESGLAWSPDGLWLYFGSDRDGTESIYRATVARTRGEVKDAFDTALGRKPAADEADEPAAADDTPAAGAGADQPATTADLVTGSWSGIVAIPDVGDVPIVMELELGPDGLVSGTLTAGESEGGPITGLFNDATGAIQLTISLGDGMTVALNGTISESSMTATADYMGVPVDVRATRTATPGDAAAPAPAPAGDEPADPETKDATKDEKKDDEKDPALDPDRWQDAIEFTIDPVVTRLSNDRDPMPGPDGLHLMFRGIRGNLHVLNLATGEIEDLLEHWDSGIQAVWSPDGRYVAWAVDDLNFNQDIWIHEMGSDEAPINITKHPDNDGSPSWSYDGKLMAFTSERVGEEYDVWVVALDEDIEALRGPDLDAYWDAAGKAARARKPLEPMTIEARAKAAAEAAAKLAEDGDAAEAEADAPFTREDLESAYLRLRRLTRLEGSEFRATILPAGDRVIFSASGLASGLHSVNWNGSGRKELGGGGRVVGTDLSGGKLVLVSGGQAQTMSSNGGGRDTVAIRDRILVDLEQQSSQKFLEAARALGENYYHPTMNGLDWAGLTRQYHELARGAFTSDEFNWVANRFIGELNGSHLGIRAPGDVDTPLRESRGDLGVTTRVVDEGAGREVTAIMPRSPAAMGEMALRIGDVIVGIEGEPIGPLDTLAGRLKGQAGEETIVTVRRTLTADDAADRAGEAVTVDLLMTPTSFGGIRGLGYEAWVLERKRLVDEWSGGRLGYIHIQGMNQASLDVYERDLFAAVDGRDGLIVDVRNNGGGSTADLLLGSIMVQSHAYTLPRGADWSITGKYPQDRLYIQRYIGPMNFLCNEKSYSNAEIISHAFKTLDRGTLVGMQTHGSVISTGGIRLIDGTSVRMPFRGWFVDDGTGRDMELNGAMPDLVVPQTPEDEAAGEDEQLRVAVQDLLERLDG